MKIIRWRSIVGDENRSRSERVNTTIHATYM